MISETGVRGHQFRELFRDEKSLSGTEIKKWKLTVTGQGSPEGAERTRDKQNKKILLQTSE